MPEIWIVWCSCLLTCWCLSRLDFKLRGAGTSCDWHIQTCCQAVIYGTLALRSVGRARIFSITQSVSFNCVKLLRLIVITFQVIVEPQELHTENPGFRRTCSFHIVLRTLVLQWSVGMSRCQKCSRSNATQ